MAGFWYPYADFAETRGRLCAFADAAVSPQCGVSFSDGSNISVVRQPSGGTDGRTLWLNVLTQHVGGPPPAPAVPNGTLGKLKAWFWRAMEIEGQAELQNAEAQQAASQAMAQEFQDHVWQPVHQFLLRHKLAADTAGVALDVVGVAAAAVFFFVAAPELLAAGTALAAVGLITGTSAGLGSIVLLGIDGTVYGAEVSGHNAFAAKIEDNKTVQWTRIGASIMLLPDIAVGGVRSLTEIGQLGNEAREATSATAEAAKAAAEARARVAKIRNPANHPDPVARRMHKVRVLEREAQTQAQKVEWANSRIRTVAVRDVGVFQGATLAGTGLLSAVPPGVVLDDQQKRRDEEYQKSLVPHGGMPKDVRLEMRVIGYSRPGAQ